MASVRQLVDAPTMHGRLGYLARPRTDPEVRHVALIEDLDDLPGVDDHAIVLLTRGASAAASTFRFDVALRRARSRRVAAVVLAGGDVASITPTSPAVADRSGTALLGARAGVDLAELALAIGRELSGGAELALFRAHAALRAVQANGDGRAAETIAERAGAALGVALRSVPEEPRGTPRAPVVVDGQVEGWLTAAAQDGDLAQALDLVLHLAAVATGIQRTSDRIAEDLPAQSRSEILTELLTAPLQSNGDTLRRARSAGLPIDGWHVAARLELEELADRPDQDALAEFRERLELERATLQAVRAMGGTWHGARAGRALVLVRAFSHDPGPGAAADVAEAMDAAMRRVGPRLPAAARLRCGVGGAHPGADGLRASAAEARAAITSVSGSDRGRAIVFDSVGLRRMLVDWYATDVAQEAVRTVLAPTAGSGARRRSASSRPCTSISTTRAR